MTKLIRLQDYILIGAALLGDVHREFKLVGGLVPNLLEARYGFVPPNYKRSSYQTAVSSLLKIGDIQKKINTKGEIYLELSSSGRQSFKRSFPIFHKSEWDGEFMIVVFDIPEQNRKIRQDIRNKLKDLGFGMLQESVWISPYHFEEDLEDYIVKKGYYDLVFVLRARKVLGKDIKSEAGRIWNLKNINSVYKDIIERTNNMEDKMISDNQIKDLWNLYFQTLASDPLLPIQILPDDWLQKEALKSLERTLNLVKVKRSLKNK